MIVEYSKSFEKSVRKLSGKMLESVKTVILEVVAAEELNEITNCRKIVGFDNVYRIRIGDLRALFLFTIIKNEESEDSESIVVFEYLISRGQVYSKKINEQLKRLDK
jgi:mRNA-degrading endonuclease RelE of RelBE toxin-antitoxin system